MASVDAESRAGGQQGPIDEPVRLDVGGHVVQRSHALLERRQIVQTWNVDQRNRHVAIGAPRQEDLLDLSEPRVP